MSPELISNLIFGSLTLSIALLALWQNQVIRVAGQYFTIYALLSTMLTIAARRDLELQAPGTAAL